MAKLPGLSPLLPFVLACLAFAFTIVSITSRDWARQKHYDPSLDMKDWKTPIYTTYRSPFRICEVTQSTSGNTTVYTLHCNTFRPHGFDKTSCETVFATQNYSNANTGDERLCQQIHYAGNLAITSTTFVSLGFVLTLLMMLLSFTAARSSSSEESGGGPSYTPALNLILIISFSIGAVTAILAQFYGIIAFIQSQPDNGAFAAARGNVGDPTVDISHAPWIEGRALRAWVTAVWVFSAFAAGAAASVWRLPTWQKVV